MIEMSFTVQLFFLLRRVAAGKFVDAHAQMPDCGSRPKPLCYVRHLDRKKRVKVHCGRVAGGRMCTRTSQ